MKDALALALVHFLWQGALIGVLGWGLMRLGRTASVRYVVGVVTLVAMFAAPVITFGVLASRVPAPVIAPTDSALVSPTGTPTLRSQVLPGPTTTPASSIPALPTTWILAAWLLGVSVLSTRVVGGWVVARRLVTSGVTPLADEIAEAASALALRMGIQHGVRVLASSRAAVPMMLGWWRPVVLIPVSTLTGMPLRQLEALLAHEFAHIRRHDYLVNLMQTFIETICFYHPAVWLVSREVRRERELCCDDIGVATCDRVTYVIALARVAEIASPQLALAASGGSLRDRIRRLVLPESQLEPARGGWLLLIPVIVLLAFAVPHAMPSQTLRPQIQNDDAPVVTAVAPVTRTPARVAPLTDAAPAQASPARAVRTPSARQVLADLRELQKADLETKGQLEEQHRQLQLTLERNQAEAQRLRALFERGLATKEAVDKAERLETLTVDTLASQTKAIALVQARMATSDTQIARLAGTTLSLATSLVAGDILTVAIADEPLLPREYEVARDGSIRFPVLGKISVIGHTAAQVRVVLADRLTALQPGSQPHVTVSAIRPVKEQR